MRLYFQRRTLLAAGRADEDEVPLREAVAIQLEKIPDKWPAYNTQSLLGGTLLALGRHAEAQPVLLAGNAGLQERAEFEKAEVAGGASADTTRARAGNQPRWPAPDVRTAYINSLTSISSRG